MPMYVGWVLPISQGDKSRIDSNAIRKRGVAIFLYSKYAI